MKREMSLIIHRATSQVAERLVKVPYVRATKRHIFTPLHTLFFQELLDSETLFLRTLCLLIRLTPLNSPPCHEGTKGPSQAYSPLDNIVNLNGSNTEL